MSEYRFRIAREEDREGIIRFLNTHWDIRHPLANLPDFFDYYYKAGDNRLNFALAESGGELAALAGFVPASISIRPDVWVSLWVANPAARGCGLELMAAMPELLNCHTLACNNIRPETRLFYEFLGYTTGRVGHFYRLADRDRYTVAQPAKIEILPTGGLATLVEYADKDSYGASGFIPPENAVPYKDQWYITRRYYKYPRQKYRVFGVLTPDVRVPRALLVLRVVPVENTCVLRIVDFIGPPDLLPETGNAMQGLMDHFGAEYAELYCAGVDPQLLAAAGFCERREDDASVIPNYLSPPLYLNTDYYYFTSNPEGFTLFRADGDQDRPNVPVPE